MYEGIKWLTPDIADLRNRMRVAYENNKLREKKGKKALEDAKQLTWDNSAKQIVKLISNNKK